jgi:3-hydroxyacyl-CoA dehydrogenase
LSRNICIAGSGKVARDTGMYFLKRGHALTWVSASEERIVDLQAWVDKSVRMYMKYSGGAVQQHSASFFLFDELENDTFDVIVECARECADDKQRVFSLFENRITDTTLALSASSSILPSSIHPACFGFHMFFPLEMTSIAELVFPAGTTDVKKEMLLKLCRETGITPIVQNEKNAFAVNRVLLPLQNEVFRALEKGVSAEVVNNASSSALLATGQIDFIRNVGPLVVKASVDNYRARMNPDQGRVFAALSNGLVAMDLPGWPSNMGKRLQDEEYAGSKKTLYYLFINTCFRLIEENEISAEDLARVLEDVFGADVSLEQALQNEGAQNIADRMFAQHLETGLDYFRPSGLLAA